MKAFYADGLARLYCADVLEWALWYRAEIEAGRARPFHAIVTDAPYSLGEPPPIVELLQAWLAGDKFDGFSPGFMSRVWDVMPGPQIWRALLDITYPGGYLFCFSGTRTADLLGIACRLGGWEPFDRVQNFSWIFGSGFPKSLAIDKALDASEVVPCPDCQPKVDAIQGLDVFDRADHDNITFDQALLFMVDEVRMACETCDGTGQVVGVEREVVGRSNYASRASGSQIYGQGNDGARDERKITAPATPLAQAFDGFGTALKPAHEPVLLFRRPRDGYTFAQCAREFGSGGLNIQDCRVSHNEPIKTTVRISDKYSNVYSKSHCRAGDEMASPSPAGRWPPNTHFTHVPPTLCPTCNGAGCDECGGAGVVGGCRRVGSKRVRGSQIDQVIKRSKSDSASIGNQTDSHCTGYADQDGLETVADWACVEGCAVRALDEVAGERKSGGRQDVGNRQRQSGFAMTGGNCEPSTGSASRFFVCHDWSLEIAERLAGETPFKYCAKSSRGEREAGCKDRPRKFLATMGDGIGEREHNENEPNAWVGNNHPTVKPLSLCKWLATLCLPPAQFNPRICVPFAGSGSEVIGAVLAGWTEIHAIEREQEYCEIAAARLAWWSKWAALTNKSDPTEIRALAEAAEAKEAWQGDERQTSMFELLSNPTKGEAT